MCIRTQYIALLWHRLLTFVPAFLTINIVTFSFSCSNVTNITLATDIQDAIYAATLYNTIQQKTYVQIKTIHDNSQEHDITNTDVIILSKTMLEQENTINWDTSLTTIKPKLPNGYTSITYKKMYMLSFSVPLLIALNTSTILIPEDPRITLQALQAFSVQHTNTEQIPLGALAFVPDANSQFENMFSSQTEYQQWLSRAYNDATHVLEYYRLHFDTIPYFSQLQHSNIIYKFIPSMRFFSQPPQFQNQFISKILTYNNETIPLINAVFIGITNNSKKKSQSHSNKFIAWVLQTDSQEKIIEHKKRMLPKEPNNNTFMGNSFSSNWNTNLLSLFHTYPWIWNNQPLHAQLQKETNNKKRVHK